MKIKKMHKYQIARCKILIGIGIASQKRTSLMRYNNKAKIHKEIYKKT